MRSRWARSRPRRTSTSSSSAPARRSWPASETLAVALLVAAGSGERLGADRPKAFVVLAGRPMLEWSVEALVAAGIEQIVVAVPPGGSAPPGCVGVEGGLTRSASVRSALRAAPAGEEQVVVHDAARPLVTPGH